MNWCPSHSFKLAALCAPTSIHAFVGATVPPRCWAQHVDCGGTTCAWAASRLSIFPPLSSRRLPSGRHCRSWRATLLHVLREHVAAPPSPPEDQTGELGSHLASRCGLASVSALQLAAAWMQSACGAAVLCWVAPGHLQCGVGYAELLHLMPSKRSPEKAFIPIRLTCELLLLFVQACGNASQTPGSPPV